MVNTIRSYNTRKRKERLGSGNSDLQTTLNFETFTPEKQEEILSLLDKLRANNGREGEAFFTIEGSDISFANAQNILPTLTSLFEGYEVGNSGIWMQISNEIGGAALTERQKGRQLEKVIFVRNPTRHLESDMVPKLGDKINTKHDINIWDEQGNGGHYERIRTPGELFSKEFCHVYTTEHKISQKPNVVVVVIGTNLRPRYQIMTNNPQMDEQQKKGLRQMSDQEIIDHHYVMSDGDY